MPRFSFLVILFALSCATPDDSATITPETTSVVFSDADNYQYTSSIKVEGQDLSELTNVLFSWPKLTQDLYGYPIDSVDSICQIEILNFADLGWDEVLKGIESGIFLQTDVTVFAYCAPTDASCYLDDFVMGAGHPLTLSENFKENNGTWLIRLNTCEEEKRIVAELFLVPSSKTTETTAFVTNTSSAFEVESEIKSVPVSSQSNLLFDWSALSVDGAEQDWDPSDVDSAILGRFDEGVEELKFHPHLFQDLADAFWSADFSNETKVSLDDLSNASGHTPDLTDTTTAMWVFALFGETVAEPNMPSFLVALKPQ